MPNDRREARAEAFLLRPWGLPGAEASDDLRETALLWITGGVCLLLWTALAFLLTSAWALPAAASGERAAAGRQL